MFLCWQSFRLREYAAGISEAGLLLVSFPIIEMAPPGCIKATHALVQQVAQLMAEGHHVAVHCRCVPGLQLYSA